MKSTILILFISLFFLPNVGLSQSCSIPKELKEKLVTINRTDTIDERIINETLDDLYSYSFADKQINLIKCDIYKKMDSVFFNSSRASRRLLAYRLIYIAGDNSFNARIKDRLISSESELNQSWCAEILMKSNEKMFSSDVFTFLASLDEGSLKNGLVNNFSNEKNTEFETTCWNNINSSEVERQIIAIRCLSNYQNNNLLQDVILRKFKSWNDENKKWLFFAMSNQNMYLKPTAKKYRKNEHLRKVIIKALEISSYEKDRKYADKLKSTMN